MVFLGTLVLATAGVAVCQEPPTRESPSTAPAQPPEDNHIYGVLPGYKVIDNAPDIPPLSAKQKFAVAQKDSLDWSVYVMSAGFAGLAQIQNQNPSFGQGVKGYAERYGGALADQVSGAFLTEAIFPSLLHEDPRYFRRNRGSVWRRTGYAASRIVVTRTDSGGQQFNFSEIAGNCVTVAVSNAYNPQTRDIPDNLEKFGMRLGTDLITNVLAEFWPDIKRKLFHRRESASTP